ncbi:MAG: hypothetical protein Q7R66_02950 [Undibacterium sp.]|nr:hypothetical protein [Undibacterium sp.]
MNFFLDLLFMLTAVLSLSWGLWLVRINRWPRVQVRVVKTWEEVTGHESNWTTGWLHAELEYGYQGQQYKVSWRGDLTTYRYLPSACAMVLDPAHLDQPHFPASWKIPSILMVLALLLSLNVLNHFLE